jgi:hypothetical protein
LAGAAGGAGVQDCRRHGHRWVRYPTPPRDQRVRTQDLERGEVTAYQDGVWLGWAIVPMEAIAPGEAPPKNTQWSGCRVVRGQGGCWDGALGSPRLRPKAQASPGVMYL